MTKDFLIPFLTGVTRCHMNDGKTTSDPLVRTSVQVIIFCLYPERSKNCKRPPVYSLESLNEIVTESFLILP